LRSEVTQQRGFTLIELLVSLVVAVVLTAIAIPLVGSLLVQYRMRSSASMVSGVISSTRYKAIYQGYPFAVAFSKANGTYQLSSKVPPATSFSNVGDAIPFQVSGMSIDQDNTFIFSPSGVVTSSVGALEVNLSYKGKTDKIAVSSYGNVRVTEQ
jgi:prepilin-type N-terminal cleavage/methylation domain-containing protein